MSRGRGVTQRDWYLYKDRHKGGAAADASGPSMDTVSGVRGIATARIEGERWVHDPRANDRTTRERTTETSPPWTSGSVGGPLGDVRERNRNLTATRNIEGHKEHQEIDFVIFVFFVAETS